jgi:hypothetical protein
MIELLLTNETTTHMDATFGETQAGGLMPSHSSQAQTSSQPLRPFYSGTNCWKKALTSFLTRNPKTTKGAPVAWAIHDKEDEASFRAILDALARRCDERLGRPFHPRVLMVDNSKAEKAGFEGSIWQQRGTLRTTCYFHNKKCWAEELIKTVRL